MRDSKAEFQFLDFTSRKPKPGVPETSFEAGHCEKHAKPRPDLGVYLILVSAFLAYGGIGYFAGWFDRWFQ